MSGLLPKSRVGAGGGISEAVARIRSGSHDLSAVEARARRVIEDVRAGGDAALLEYTKRLEGAELSKTRLRVSEEEMESASERVDGELLSAMRFSLDRLRATQGRVLERLRYSQVANGFVVRVGVRPLASVGCYIPGGRAAYSSTVLMTAGVAKAAGVKRVSLCTPPDASGRVNDAILAAASLCGVDEVYRVGGAQAVAAMAYGTETVAAVQKIVGPGGIYVAAAKRLVSVDVPVDFFAGPTELVVVGDESADPRTVAWDLVGQAEHGEDSVCGLVTWSEGLADAVREELEGLVPGVERRRFVEGCLRRGFAAVCGSREEAAEMVNALAPEHLELMVSDPRGFASSILNAGLILSGSFSPCAASDYCVGTDHVLPTEGFAAYRGGLSSLDFVKTVWMVEGSKEGLRAILPSLKALAYAEGLPNHYLSVESRFDGKRERRKKGR